MSQFQFVKPHVEAITEKDPYKKIELAGRTCYKSEGKITADSAKKFVKGLIKSQHTAMVEHQVFVFDLTLIGECTDGIYNIWYSCLKRTPFLHVTMRYCRKTGKDRILVSGNVRALNEDAIHGAGTTSPLLRCLQRSYPDLVYSDTNAWETINDHRIELVSLDTLPELDEEEIATHKHLTFRFITDRGVTHEMVRHRPASYAQESTRYVNYLSGISIALPTGFYDKAPEVQEVYQQAFQNANDAYGQLIEMGEKPQQARAVLPTATKTEIVMTANVAEWEHVFDLRLRGTTGAPHPDIKTVMAMAYDLAKQDPLFTVYDDGYGL